MPSSEQSVVLDTLLANEIVALLDNPGWLTALNEMFCLFGTDLQAELTPTGIHVQYVDVDNELIDFLVPLWGSHAAKVTFVGQYTLHTIKLDWEDPWDDELTVTRSLTFVNDTLRMRESRINAENAGQRLYALRKAVGRTRMLRA